ncbi:MAG: hypothetical protein KBS54_07550, partial [Synergistaceae bacterium]|nr:hypothetical protein [Candidatus Equadaptatus faecalis]
MLRTKLRKTAAILMLVSFVFSTASPALAGTGLVIENTDPTTPQRVTAENVGEGSAAIGYHPQAVGDYSMALGVGVVSVGAYSMAMGAFTKTSADLQAVTNWLKNHRNDTIEHEVNIFVKYMVDEKGHSELEGKSPYEVLSGDWTFSPEEEEEFKTLKGKVVMMAEEEKLVSAYSTSMGFYTTAGGDYSTATGRFTAASGTASFAGGTNSRAYSDNSFAFGNSAVAGGKRGGDNAIAFGSLTSAVVNQYYGAKVQSILRKEVPAEVFETFYHDVLNRLENAGVIQAEKAADILLGASSPEEATQILNDFLDGLKEPGLDAVAVLQNIVEGPSGTTASGENAIAIGNSSTLQGTLASGDNSAVFGNDAKATAVNALALGTNANASHADGVAIGANSETKAVSAGDAVTKAVINGKTYTYTTTTAESVVSVGKAGAERQIVNVANGAVNATSTDAVNGSQLYQTQQSVDDLGTVVGVQVDGTTLKSKIANTYGNAKAAKSEISAAIDSLDAAIGSRNTGITSTNYLAANKTVVESLSSLDKAMGKTAAKGSYINASDASNTLASNIGLLDTALAKGYTLAADSDATGKDTALNKKITVAGSETSVTGKKNITTSITQSDGNATLTVALGETVDVKDV